MESIHYYCVLAKKVPAYCIKDGRRVLDSLEGKGCELVDRTPAAGRAYLFLEWVSLHGKQAFLSVLTAVSLGTMGREGISDTDSCQILSH